MRKSRWLAGLLVLALVLTLVPAVGMGASTSASAPFWDIAGGPYEAPVTALYEIGVVGGTSSTTYSPHDLVTRAQMAALLVRALNLKDVTDDFAPRFSDVPKGHWAFRSVMMANQLGVVRGVSATDFAPNDPVTYAQATAMVLRALAYDRGDISFPVGTVTLASELGLTTGLQWDMNGNMTRGEVAVLLANAVFKVNHKVYGKTLSQQLFKHPVSLTIQPDSRVVVSGTVQLTATGADAYGAALDQVIASWTVMSGDATITPGGTLTANGGHITVRATVGDLAATRSFDVVSGMAITPNGSTSQVGDTLKLQAVNPSDSSVSLPTVTWSVVSGPASVQQDGTLSFTGAGTVAVKATCGSLVATAQFSSIAGLQIVPQTVLTTPGDTVQFSVKQPDGTPFTGSVQWSVDGAGVITPDGKFTATGGTAPTIRAKAGSLTASAKVQVLNRLVVSPSENVTVAKGKTVQFTASGVTTGGDEVAVPVTWSSTSRVGVIDGSGQFVGTNSGSGQVTAAYGKVSQSVSVAVSGDAYTVALTASRISFPANGRVPITINATLKDINGVTVPASTPVQFYITDASKATLNTTSAQSVNGVATVTLTPTTQAGSIRVTAVANDLALVPGYLDLSSYVAVPSRVKLVAAPDTVAAAAGSRAVVSATLVDNEGYEIPNVTGTSVTVSLISSNPTASSLTSNIIYIGSSQSRGDTTFIANNAGDTTISGFSNYPVDPVTIHAMVAGPAAKVIVRPGITDTKADGTTDMIVYAEIRDANGVVRTQDTGTVVQLTAVSEDGATTLPVQTAMVQSGVATFKVHTITAGRYTFTANASGLQLGTGSGLFVPGTATKIRLTAEPTASIAADGVSTIRLRAQIVDAQGNLVPTASNIITFSRVANGGATTLPAVMTATAVNGAAEITVTSTIYPATDTFKAVAANLAESSLLQVTSKITGVASQLVASAVGTPTVSVGGSMQLKVYLEDARGQIVTSENGRIVHLASSSPTATVIGNGVVQAGVATFTVSDTSAGTTQFTITADGMTTSSVYSVAFLSSSVARIDLKLATSEMSADGGQSFVQVSADAVDAYGNKVVQAIPVTLYTDRPDVATLSSQTLSTGSFTTLRSTSITGTARISGTASVPVTPVTISTFVPGAPAKVKVDPITSGQVGQQLTFRVRVIDTNGHVLTSLNTGSGVSAMGIYLNGSLNNTALVSNSTNFGLPGFTGNGRSQGSVSLVSGVATFTYSNTVAENVTVTPVFYYNGVQLPAESGTISTTSGKAAKLVLTPGRKGLSTITSETTTIDAVLTDANGNPVSVSDGDTFVFTLSTGNYLTVTGPTSVATSNGKASISVSSVPKPTGGTTTITVRSTKTGFSAVVDVVTDLTPSTPQLWAADPIDGDTTLSTGENAIRVVIQVDPRVSTQTVILYVNGVQVPVYTNVLGSSTVSTVAPGSNMLVGYILRQDMGYYGPKSIRAVVQTDVGMSPMSNGVTFSLQ